MPIASLAPPAPDLATRHGQGAGNGEADHSGANDNAVDLLSHVPVGLTGAADYANSNLLA